MPSFSKMSENLESDLQDQIAYLRKEVSSLRKSLSKRGAQAFDDTRGGAADLYEELASRFIDAIPMLRKQAKAAGKTVNDNQAIAAVVGVAVVGLAIALFRRR